MKGLQHFVGPLIMSIQFKDVTGIPINLGSWENNCTDSFSINCFFAFLNCFLYFFSYSMTSKLFYTFVENE